MKPQIYIFQTQFLIFATCSSLRYSPGQKDEIEVLSVYVKWSKFRRLGDCERNLQHDFDIGRVSFGRAFRQERIINRGMLSKQHAIAYKLHRPEVRQTSSGGRLKSPKNTSTSIRHA
jgi:hypothetical protein